MVTQNVDVQENKVATFTVSLQDVIPELKKKHFTARICKSADWEQNSPILKNPTECKHCAVRH